MLGLRILAIVFPVFAIIGLGWWYGRAKRPDLGAVNQISMDVLVPALVFAALASKDFDFARHAPPAASGTHLPQPLYTAIEMVGDASIPMLVFALGVRLNQVSFHDWPIGLASAIVAPATGIVMVLGITPFLDLDPMQQSILLVFGALPPAVLNYLMAEQYGQEPERVASIVLLGNLAALMVMPVVLAFALGGAHGDQPRRSS